MISPFILSAQSNRVVSAFVLHMGSCKKQIRSLVTYMYGRVIESEFSGRILPQVSLSSYTNYRKQVSHLHGSYEISLFEKAIIHTQFFIVGKFHYNHTTHMSHKKP